MPVITAGPSTPSDSSLSVAQSQQSLPPSHPTVPASPSKQVVSSKSLIPEPRFSHFRVGNRNVKGMFSQDDLMWIGTSGGVIRYELKTDNYQLFDVSKGNLISNGVFHVSELNGSIVVGTYGGGMSIYNPKLDKWRNYNIPDGLADQFVYDVQKVKNGDVWIATWSGVNRVIDGDLDNPDKWETYNPENTQGGLPNDWVYGLAEGKDGEMWFATEDGLARFYQGKWTNWQHKDGLGAAYDLVKDDIKFSRDPGKASRHHAKQKAEQGLGRVKVAYNPNYIVSLVVDNDGIVWCGTWGGGLAKFDGKAWRNYTVKDGLPSNHVFMLHKDPNGFVWAGTSHGLAKILAGGKFKVLTRRDGLYADNVFSMANASDGSIWVGSFGGVARISGQL
ncbi:MAG TPA: regulator [Gammaproteobacteria bacterium]|nr:regulator [Gammaproteobacteria bacterium]